MNRLDYELTSEGRLLSLDVFRGLTMFLLIAEATGLYAHLVDPALNGTVITWIVRQFHHHTAAGNSSVKGFDFIDSVVDFAFHGVRVVTSMKTDLDGNLHNRSPLRVLWYAGDLPGITRWSI